VRPAKLQTRGKRRQLRKGKRGKAEEEERVDCSIQDNGLAMFFEEESLRTQMTFEGIKLHKRPL